MMGRILGKSSNKKEVFIADTGTSVTILPVNIAKHNGVIWTPEDADEPAYVGVTAVEVDILGQANVWTVFDDIKGGHNLQALAVRQEAEEILINLDTLIDLSIISPDFPLPQDPEMRSDSCKTIQENNQKMNEFIEELEKKVKKDSCRKVQQSPYQVKEFTLDSEVGPKLLLVSIQERQGSIRSALQFHKVNEETIDEDQDVEKLRKKLLRKYAAVVKHDLGKEDRFNLNPVKIELIDSSKDMGNAMIPAETPHHLQDAAAEELAGLLKSGCLEPVHNPTDNCSRAFFVQRNSKDGTIKARLVTDVRKVNTNLKRVGTPLDGSSHILKRLQP